MLRLIGRHRSPSGPHGWSARRDSLGSLACVDRVPAYGPPSQPRSISEKHAGIVVVPRKQCLRAIRHNLRIWGKDQRQRDSDHGIPLMSQRTRLPCRWLKEDTVLVCRPDIILRCNERSASTLGVEPCFSLVFAYSCCNIGSLLTGVPN